jgi:hypothetical protein
MEQRFDIRTSLLLQTAVNEEHFDPWEFFEDGEYATCRELKEEVEVFASSYAAGLDADDVERELTRREKYPRDWVPERLAACRTRADLIRLLAFAELHLGIARAEEQLELESLARPRVDDPVFAGRPDLFELLTSADGLLPIGAENIEEPYTGTNAAFFVGNVSLYAHPLLAPYRELLAVLAAFAGEPELDVYVAIDPYRRSARGEVPYKLLEDRWDGMVLTPETLDSLDSHDQGHSFHAAVNRSEADELFHPLLGTHFDWRARRPRCRRSSQVPLHPRG